MSTDLRNIWQPGAAQLAQKEADVTATASAAPKQSWLEKIWSWITGEVKHVEQGIEEIFGSDAAQKIEAAGAALLKHSYGPLLTAAIADATDVVTGQMSVSKAIASLVALFEAEGKQLSQAAALQIIGVAQNALPAKPATVTPTS